MSNPNGLSDEQIAARPGPFVGMLVCYPSYGKKHTTWHTVSSAKRYEGTDLICVDGGMFRTMPCLLLLPGEKNCPWPPPPEFRREWVEGDRAWILQSSGWYKARYILAENRLRDGELTPLFVKDFGPFKNVTANTPAIYIPKGEQ